MKKILHELFSLEHVVVTVVTFGLLFLLTALSFNIQFLSPIARSIKEFSLSDMYYEADWMGETPDTSRMVTLVDITRLHKRGEIAKVLGDIDACNPAVVGIDILFEGVKDDEDGNRQLEEVLGGMDETVVACKLTDYQSRHKSFSRCVSSFFMADTPLMEGYTNVGESPTTTVLRYMTVERPLRGESVLSFPAQIVTLYRDEEIPAQERSDRFINYRCLEFPVIDCDSVLLHRELLEGRIVLVGTMTEEQDMHFTPLGKMPGLKVQAYSVQTLLEQKNIVILSSVGQWLTAIVVAYLTVVLFFFLLRYIEGRKSLVGAFLYNSKLFQRFLLFLWMSLITWASYVSYEHYGIYVPMALVLLPVVLMFEARNLYTAVIKALPRTRFRRFGEKSLYRPANQSDPPQ